MIEVRFPEFTSIESRLNTFLTHSEHQHFAFKGFFVQKKFFIYIVCNFCQRKFLVDSFENYSWINALLCDCDRKICLSHKNVVENINSFKDVDCDFIHILAVNGYSCLKEEFYFMCCYVCGFISTIGVDMNHYNGREICPLMICKSTAMFKKRCNLCYYNEANCCILPCGHVLYCVVCTAGFVNCPECESMISNVVSIFVN